MDVDWNADCGMWNVVASESERSVRRFVVALNIFDTRYSNTLPGIEYDHAHQSCVCVCFCVVCVMLYVGQW